MGGIDSNDLGIRLQSVANAGVLCCIRLIMAFVVPTKPRMEKTPKRKRSASFWSTLGKQTWQTVRGHCVGRLVLGELCSGTREAYEVGV